MRSNIAKKNVLAISFDQIPFDQKSTSTLHTLACWIVVDIYDSFGRRRQYNSDDDEEEAKKKPTRTRRQSQSFKKQQQEAFQFDVDEALSKINVRMSKLAIDQEKQKKSALRLCADPKCANITYDELKRLFEFAKRQTDNMNSTFNARLEEYSKKYKYMDRFKTSNFYYFYEHWYSNVRSVWSHAKIVESRYKTTIDELGRIVKTIDDFLNDTKLVIGETLLNEQIVFVLSHNLRLFKHYAESVASNKYFENKISFFLFDVLYGFVRIERTPYLKPTRILDRYPAALMTYVPEVLEDDDGDIFVHLFKMGFDFAYKRYERFASRELESGWEKRIHRYQHSKIFHLESTMYPEAAFKHHAQLVSDYVDSTIGIEYFDLSNDTVSGYDDLMRTDDFFKKHYKRLKIKSNIEAYVRLKSIRKSLGYCSFLDLRRPGWVTVKNDALKSKMNATNAFKFETNAPSSERDVSLPNDANNIRFERSATSIVARYDKFENKLTYYDPVYFKWLHASYVIEEDLKPSYDAHSYASFDDLTDEPSSLLQNRRSFYYESKDPMILDIDSNFFKPNHAKAPFADVHLTLNRLVEKISDSDKSPTFYTFKTWCDVHDERSPIVFSQKNTDGDTILGVKHLKLYVLLVSGTISNSTKSAYVWLKVGYVNATKRRITDLFDVSLETNVPDDAIVLHVPLTTDAVVSKTENVVYLTPSEPRTTTETTLPETNGSTRDDRVSKRRCDAKSEALSVGVQRSLFAHAYKRGITLVQHLDRFHVNSDIFHEAWSFYAMTFNDDHDRHHRYLGDALKSIYEKRYAESFLNFIFKKEYSRLSDRPTQNAPVVSSCRIYDDDDDDDDDPNYDRHAVSKYDDDDDVIMRDATDDVKVATIVEEEEDDDDTGSRALYANESDAYSDVRFWDLYDDRKRNRTTIEFEGDATCRYDDDFAWEHRDATRSRFLKCNVDVTLPIIVESKHKCYCLPYTNDANVISYYVSHFIESSEAENAFEESTLDVVPNAGVLTTACDAHFFGASKNILMRLCREDFRLAEFYFGHSENPIKYVPEDVDVSRLANSSSSPSVATETVRGDDVSTNLSEDATHRERCVTDRPKGIVASNLDYVGLHHSCVKKLLPNWNRDETNVVSDAVNNVAILSETKLRKHLAMRFESNTVRLAFAKTGTSLYDSLPYLGDTAHDACCENMPHPVGWGNNVVFVPRCSDSNVVYLLQRNGTNYMTPFEESERAYRLSECVVHNGIKVYEGRKSMSNNPREQSQLPPCDDSVRRGCRYDYVTDDDDKPVQIPSIVKNSDATPMCVAYVPLLATMYKTACYEKLSFEETVAFALRHFDGARFLPYDVCEKGREFRARPLKFYDTSQLYRKTSEIDARYAARSESDPFTAKALDVKNASVGMLYCTDVSRDEDATINTLFEQYGGRLGAFDEDHSKFRDSIDTSRHFSFYRFVNESKIAELESVVFGSKEHRAMLVEQTDIYDRSLKRSLILSKTHEDDASADPNSTYPLHRHSHLFSKPVDEKIEASEITSVHGFKTSRHAFAQYDPKENDGDRLFDYYLHRMNAISKDERDAHFKIGTKCYVDECRSKHVTRCYVNSTSYKYLQKYKKTCYHVFKRHYQSNVDTLLQRLLDYFESIYLLKCETERPSQQYRRESKIFNLSPEFDLDEHFDPHPSHDALFESKTKLYDVGRIIRHYMTFKNEKSFSKYFTSKVEDESRPTDTIIGIVLSTAMRMARWDPSHAEADDHLLCALEKQRFYEAYAKDDRLNVTVACRRLGVATGMISEAVYLQSRTDERCTRKSYRSDASFSNLERVMMRSTDERLTYDYVNKNDARDDATDDNDDDEHCCVDDCIYCVTRSTLKKETLASNKFKIECRPTMGKNEDVFESVPHICLYDESKLKNEIACYDFFLKWLLKLATPDVLHKLSDFNFVHPKKASKIHDICEFLETPRQSTY